MRHSNCDELCSVGQNLLVAGRKETVHTEQYRLIKCESLSVDFQLESVATLHCVSAGQTNVKLLLIKSNFIFVSDVVMMNLWSPVLTKRLHLLLQVPHERSAASFDRIFSISVRICSPRRRDVAGSSAVFPSCSLFVKLCSLWSRLIYSTRGFYSQTVNLSAPSSGQL